MRINLNTVKQSFYKLAEKSGRLFCEVWKAASAPFTHQDAQSCNRLLCPSGIFALAKLPCGLCVVVKKLEMAQDKAESLRRIGIREGCRISLLNSCDPMLVQVDNSRIAVSQSLASYIKVESSR